MWTYQTLRHRIPGRAPIHQYAYDGDSGCVGAWAIQDTWGRWIVGCGLKANPSTMQWSERFEAACVDRFGWAIRPHFAADSDGCYVDILIPKTLAPPWNESEAFAAALGDLIELAQHCGYDLPHPDHKGTTREYAYSEEDQRQDEVERAGEAWERWKDEVM